MVSCAAKKVIVRATLTSALATLCACSSTGSLFRNAGSNNGGSTNSTTAEAGSGVIDTDGLAVYLETMQRLIEGDSLTRAATFSDLQDAAEFAPTTTNRLLYALALALPGHNGSDPVAGAERLRGLLAAGDTLLPEERMLAQIQLQSAGQLEILQSVGVDLEDDLAAALAARDAEHAQVLQDVLAENQRLEAELEDATAMLDAITNIERSLSEREDDE